MVVNLVHHRNNPFVSRNSNPLDAPVPSGVIGASDSSSSNHMTGSISSSPPASILSSDVTIAPSTGVDSTDGSAQVIWIILGTILKYLNYSVFSNRLCL